MTSTTLGHKKCLDKWGAVQILEIINVIFSLTIKLIVLLYKDKQDVFKVSSAMLKCTTSAVKSAPIYANLS
jgi:hypothetical protein